MFTPVLTFFGIVCPKMSQNWDRHASQESTRLVYSEIVYMLLGAATHQSCLKLKENSYL